MGAMSISGNEWPRGARIGVRARSASGPRIGVRLEAGDGARLGARYGWWWGTSRYSEIPGPLGYVSQVTDVHRPRIHVIENSADAGLNLLAPGLGDAEVHVVRAHAGDALPAAEDLQGLIVLGGHMNAYDDEGTPYLPALRELMAAAVDRQVPTLAICLGAQLLAVAGGGQVQVDAPTGVEAGVIEVRLRPGAEEDPVLGPVVQACGHDLQMPSMHFDAVTELPEGAEWLGASRQYPFQAFRLGSALALQFHPEASGAALAAWARQLDAGDAVQIEADWNHAAPHITKVADLLASAFTAQVGQFETSLNPV